MTQLPNANPGSETWRVHAVGDGVPPHPLLAPGREIHLVARKVLPDGRTFDFHFVRRTDLSPSMRWTTAELIQAPSIDCPCTPVSPDDIVCCANPRCMAAVCSMRHSASCMHCGKVFCSACLQGVIVRGVQAIVCRACAEDLTASLAMKALKKIKGVVWG